MNCEKCIHKDLCYENCELNYDNDDLTCHYCKLITCPEHTECKFFKDKSELEEIVRCKYCAFRYTETCFAKHETADNDFCSCGKRKVN